MEQNENLNEEQKQQVEQPETAEETTAAAENTETAEEAQEPTAEDRVVELEAKVKSLQDEYLRLMADFENFRKRTIKEKQDLLKYGAEDTVKRLLPVIDDFERAIQHNDKVEDAETLKEGFQLIYQKFQKFLTDSQITEIPAAQGDAFDDKIHDAMTMFPAPDESLKGKIIDCPTKGYKLYDKVIRFAKVVVGQ